MSEKMIPETAASAASAAIANKVTAGGFGVIGMGWASSTTTLAQLGFCITLLGGVWSYLDWRQRRRDAAAKRAEDAAKRFEEAEEHAARMRIYALEIAATEKGRLGA